MHAVMCAVKVVRRCSQFTEFYQSRHEGRKLVWLHQLGKAELTATCFKKECTIEVFVL